MLILVELCQLLFLLPLAIVTGKPRTTTKLIGLDPPLAKTFEICMFGVKYLVREFLEQEEALRDDDNLLIGSMIKTLEKNLESMTAEELLKGIEEGKYGSFVVIYVLLAHLNPKMLAGDKLQKHKLVCHSISFLLAFQRALAIFF